MAVWKNRMNTDPKPPMPPGPKSMPGPMPPGIVTVVVVITGAGVAFLCAAAACCSALRASSRAARRSSAVMRFVPVSAVTVFFEEPNDGGANWIRANRTNGSAVRIRTITNTRLYSGLFFCGFVDELFFIVVS